MEPRVMRIGGLLLATALLIAAVAQAQTLTGTAVGAERPGGPSLVGALWVPATGAPYAERTTTGPFIERLKSMPFNEYLIQVRAGGNAYYDSALVPRAPGVSESFDPLQELIAGLRQPPREKRLVAWFDPYHVGNLNDAAPLGANHVMLTHREWLSQRANGDQAGDRGDLYLEPGLPAVQEHLEAVVRELLTRYDLDVLYIDHMGDAVEGDWGFHPDVVQRWRQETGATGNPTPDDPQWQAFRARILTEALRGLVTAAREARPGIVIGVGLTAEGAPPRSAADYRSCTIFTRTHQDLPEWLTVNGVDRLYVRNFHSDAEGQNRNFDEWLKLTVAMAGEGPQVVIGVAGTQNTALDALGQLQRAAELGAGGVALWHVYTPVRDLSSERLFMDALARTVMSPEYLRVMATLNERRRLVAGESATPEAVATDAEAALVAATDGLLDDFDAMFDSDLPGTAPASTTSTLAGLRLPPPPTTIEEVPFEFGGETVVGGGSAAGSGETDEALLAMERLLQTRPTLQVSSDPAEDRQGTVNSQLRLIDELLGDPSFRQRLDTGMLGTGDAASELKKKFGNIF